MENVESTEKMKEVAIISQGKGVIVKGIERALSDAEIGVSLIDAAAEEIPKIPDSVNIFVLYLAEGISEVTACVKPLKEIVDSTGKALVVVGPKSEWNELKKYDQGLDVSAWYDKLLDMGAFSDYIKEYLNKFAIGEAKKKILLVNEDTSFAAKVQEWLEGKYRVHMVTTGTQAVEYLQENQVDLVLLDYELPEMNASEVIGMLRKGSGMKGVPVVFLTAADDKQTFIAIMELDPQGYILKDTTREDLLKRLVQVFRSK